MRNDFESNYLAHHGILGMKWGKKNGPPYPLGASDHSASEKKAGWRKSLDSRRAYKQAKRIVGKTKPYESYKALNGKNRSRMTEMVNRNISDEQRSRLKSLSEEHKRLAAKTQSGHSKKADEAFRAYNEETKKVTREILGKYGNKKLNALSLDETSYRDIVQQATEWAKVLDGQRDSKVSAKNAKKNLSDKRIVHPDIDGRGIVGIEMPNGDRLFVSTDDVKKYGVDKAVEKTNEYIKQKTAARQKQKVDKEQRALANEMLRNYDKKDPDAKEAKAVIKDIKNSNTGSGSAKWNKSSSYNKGFLDYIKDDVVKPEMVDDPELLDLLVWEYEEATGKKAMKS